MDNLIFETPYWKIVLSYDQLYFGRCVVILKRACTALSEVTTKEMADFLEVVQKYESTFKREYGAIMFNYSCLMNDAYQNDPPDPQVHWHFRPRYDKPMVFEGIDFIDPNFGHHYDREHKRLLDKELEQKIVSALRIKFK